jgi:quinol monooxygenase YgiN
LKQEEILLALRLVITMKAKEGKGGELAKLQAGRCAEVQKEPGCEQFEIFQSAVDPDKLLLLERWADQAALDVHAELNRSRPPLAGAAELRADGPGEREDYEYNRTR